LLLGVVWYCIATVLLLVCLKGWGVVLSVGGLDGGVLGVLLCWCVMFVGVVVVGRGTGDVSAGGGVRLDP